MPYTPSTRYKGVGTQTGGKTWTGWLSVNSTFPERIRASYQKLILVGTHATEDQAALALDVTRYLIYRDDRGPQPVYQTNMMTAEKVAALAGITLEQQLQAWKVASEVFSSGSSMMRGVSFHKTKKFWQARVTDPTTGKQLALASVTANKPDAEEQCARAYDRQQIKWFGSKAVPVCNFCIASYVGDADPEVHRLATAHAAGEHAQGSIAGEPRKKGDRRRPASAAPAATTTAVNAPDLFPGATAAGAQPIGPGTAQLGSAAAAAAAAHAGRAVISEADSESGAQPLRPASASGSEWDSNWESDWEDSFQEQGDEMQVQGVEDAYADAHRRLAEGRTLVPADPPTGEVADSVMLFARQEGIQDMPVSSDGEEEQQLNHPGEPTVNTPGSTATAPTPTPALAPLSLPAFLSDEQLAAAQRHSRMWAPLLQGLASAPSRPDAASNTAATALAAIIASGKGSALHLGLTGVATSSAANSSEGSRPGCMKYGADWPPSVKQMLIDGGFITPQGGVLKNFPDIDGGFEPFAGAHHDWTIEMKDPGLEKFYWPHGRLAIEDRLQAAISSRRRDLERRSIYDESNLMSAEEGGIPMPDLDRIRAVFQSEGPAVFERLAALTEVDPAYHDWYLSNIAQLRKELGDPSMHLFSAPPPPAATAAAAGSAAPNPATIPDGLRQYEFAEVMRRAMTGHPTPLGDMPEHRELALEAAEQAYYEETGRVIDMEEPPLSFEELHANLKNHPQEHWDELRIIFEQVHKATTPPGGPPFEWPEDPTDYASWMLFKLRCMGGLPSAAATESAPLAAPYASAQATLKSFALMPGGAPPWLHDALAKKRAVQQAAGANPSHPAAAAAAADASAPSGSAIFVDSPVATTKEVTGAAPNGEPFAFTAGPSSAAGPRKRSNSGARRRTGGRGPVPRSAAAKTQQKGPPNLDETVSVQGGQGHSGTLLSQMQLATEHHDVGMADGAAVEEGEQPAAPMQTSPTPQPRGTEQQAAADQPVSTQTWTQDQIDEMAEWLRARVAANPNALHETALEACGFDASSAFPILDAVPPPEAAVISDYPPAFVQSRLRDAFSQYGKEAPSADKVRFGAEFALEEEERQMQALKAQATQLAADMKAMEARLQAQETSTVVQDFLQERRCLEWNYKVLHALDNLQVCSVWLYELLGPDWRAIVDAHPEGDFFGPHRPPPDISNPFNHYGFHEPDGTRGLPLPVCVDMAWSSAASQLGTGGERFLEKAYRYWLPNLAAEAKEAAALPRQVQATRVKVEDLSEYDRGVIEWMKNLPDDQKIIIQMPPE